MSNFKAVTLALLVALSFLLGAEAFVGSAEASCGHAGASSGPGYEAGASQAGDYGASHAHGEDACRLCGGHFGHTQSPLSVITFCLFSPALASAKAPPALRQLSSAARRGLLRPPRSLL